MEDRLDGSSERLTTLLRDRAEDAIAILDAAATRWGEQFESRDTQLRQTINSQNAAVETLFDELTNRLVGAISFQGAATQAQIETSTTESLAKFNADAARINERFAELAGDAAATVAIGANNVHDALSGQVAKFDAIIGERGSGLVDSLSQQTGRMNEYLEAIDNLVGENGHSVVERIAAHSDQLNARIASQVDAVDVMMQARRDDFDRRFAANVEQLSARSAQRLGQFEAVAAAHHDAVDLAVASHSRQIETTLGEGLARFEVAIDGRGRDIVRQIGERSEALGADLAAKLAAIEETLVTGGGAVDERLGRRNEEAAALVRHPPAGDRRAGRREAGSGLDDARGVARAHRGRPRPAGPRAVGDARPQHARSRPIAGRRRSRNRARHGRQVGRNRRNAAAGAPAN